MAYTKQFPSPEEGMNIIIDAINNFNVDHFRFALTYKDFGKGKIQALTDYVVEATKKLEKEYSRLKSFGETFNTQYATLNNKYVSTALTLMRKMRSGVKGIKDLFKDFCPRQSSKDRYMRRNYNLPEPSIFSNGFACTCSKDMFGFEGYDDCVEALYSAIDGFMLLSRECFKICRDLIREERRIKADKGYCNYLFDEQVNGLIEDYNAVVVMIPKIDKEVLKDNPLYVGEKIYGTHEANVQANFHNCSIDNVRKYCFYRTYTNSGIANFDPYEKIVWHDDPQAAYPARVIISHIDDFLPTTSKRKKLPADYIAMFLIYEGISNVQLGYDYFTEQYTKFGGKYELTKYRAVDTEYKKLCNKPESFEEYQRFVNQINNSNFVPLDGYLNNSSVG